MKPPDAGVNAADTFDVIVLGSGAGGMSAALTAAIEGGCRVLLIERSDRVGGSTAISGGAIWAPLNAQSAALGHPDTAERVHTYLRHTVGDASPLALQQAYVGAAAAMVDWFARHTELHLAGRSFSPDYYPDRDGAALGGRTLDPMEFDGRRLGPHFADLRDPLPEFVVLGGMMVNMTDVRHLLAVTRSWASWRHGMKLLLRYAGDRLRGHHRGTRLLLGNALAARLYRSLLDRGIELRRSTEVRRLLPSPSGRIEGVELADGRHLLARRGVVVATGGFPWDEALRRELVPAPTGPWSMAPQDNRGEGIALARQAGAVLGTGHSDAAFWAPVSLLQRADGSVQRYPHLVWDRAKPGLMAVDGRGDRFVNESTSYHEFVRAMQRTQAAGRPGVPACLIADADFVERWGLGLALPGGRPRQHLVRAGYLHRADSLAALAGQLGLEPQRLAAAAAQFNQAAEAGVDEAFGKGSTAYNRYLGDADHQPNPCLGPLRRAPFYAVQVYPGDIGTACGIHTDARARALDAGGAVIEGLYVVGNDMQSVMGGQYPAPGITLGPALTFGWLAGLDLASDLGPSGRGAGTP